MLGRQPVNFQLKNLHLSGASVSFEGKLRRDDLCLPFSNTASIQFNLNSGDFSSIEIRVLDQVGKEVRHIPVNSAKEGSNTVELNMQNLPSGIYYYSLIVNGAQADTKKMVVVR